MSEYKLPILIIDRNKNVVELEMDSNMYRALRITPDMIHKHNRRIELNETITQFLRKHKNNQNK